MASKIAIATGIVCLYSVSMVLGMTTGGPSAAPSCTSVDAKLLPCVAYIESDLVKKPSTACCRGVKALADSASSKADRVAVCICLKSALNGLKGKVIEERVTILPKMCEVAIHLPPFDDGNFDCSTWSA